MILEEMKHRQALEIVHEIEGNLGGKRLTAYQIDQLLDLLRVILYEEKCR